MEHIVETAQSIGIILAEILLAIYFCKQYIDKYQKEHKPNISDEVTKQNPIDLDIIEKMDYYKELLKADRILLFEFHNGQHYSNYRSALKMSASYEVYRAGLESSREKCSNLPIAIMPRFIASITREGFTWCKDIEEIKYDMGNSYEFKKSIGIKAFYDVAIKDECGNVVGFVAVQWQDDMPTDIDVKNIDHLAWHMEEAVKKLTALGKEQNKSFSIFKKKNKKSC
jgi:hypothetical protein